MSAEPAPASPVAASPQCHVAVVTKAAAASPRVLLAWHRFGPYHHARARAAAALFECIGLEITTVDRTNSWKVVEGAEGFEKLTLCSGLDVHKLRPSELRARIEALLAGVDPDVVIVDGYAARPALALLDWALRHNRRAIVMSESNKFDEARRPWRESLKSRMVGLFAAALAGGCSARDYLVALGLPPERVFVGYDAVDNAHFARARVAPLPDCSGLAGPYFLASARFVEKKNLPRLIDAYASYHARSGDHAWQLVILGDGPLRPEIEARIARAGLSSAVRLPGYKQYDELPSWYGAAACFIHPSTTEQWGLVVNEAMAAGLPVLVSDRCGCAADLVREGVNGFTFDPYDIQAMANLMHRVAHGDVDREAMGRASQSIIAEWGPDRFADGLTRAVEAALAASPPKPSLLDRALLWALIHR